ncbi:MAG: hypothetical protein KatS3mg105_2688 [Gemmatales bacterium]|nr:MAG: hypothetical protein KatS3mg105_2688 [Gemmatales bacterium]
MHCFRSNLLFTSKLQDPTLALVHISLLGGPLDELQLEGQLAGPKCRFSKTVEVPYALSRAPKSVGSWPAWRIFVPEPCLWEPSSPFLYQGRFVLRRQTEVLAEVQTRIGFKSIAMSGEGIRLNGEVLRLRAKRIECLTEKSAQNLRELGYNTVIASSGQDIARIYDTADEFGFLVLALVDASNAEEMHQIKSHASCLGWIVKCEDFANLPAVVTNDREVLLGVQLSSEADVAVPHSAQFVFRVGARPTFERVVVAEGRKSREVVLLGEADS